MARLEQRFWDRVDKNGPIPEYRPDLGPCWIWKAGKTKGYGTISVDGKSQYAYKLTYELLVSPVPDDLQLDHLCRVRACVNPGHLETVTRRENILRGFGAGANAARKTHCKNGHPFTPENTILRKSRVERVCAICYRQNKRAYYTSEYWREWRAKKRQAAA